MTGTGDAEQEKQEPGRYGQHQMEQYLVAPRPPQLMTGALAPVDTDTLFGLLEDDPEIEVISTFEPDHSHPAGAEGEPYSTCPPFAVVRTTRAKAAALAAGPQMIVEIDQPLTFHTVSPLAPAVAAVDPALAVPLTEPAEFRVRVTGPDDTPVSGAHVWAVGAGWPAHAITAHDGRATLVLPAGTPEEVRTLHIRPARDYWPARIDDPGLRGLGHENEVRLQALSGTMDGFPERAIPGWGRQAMRLNQLPPTYRGHGITIALVDSGISSSHPDLREAVAAGHDFTIADSKGWEDATGHGTACAGVIAAADNRTGITGIVADAKLHSLKVHPGGRVSDLLRALDRCITEDVDIVQINLICPAPSTLLAMKIHDLRTAGVVCVAPAGDDGTTVAFPASHPDVIAVGALGLAGTYPAGTTHAAHGGRQATTGPFIPAFSPLGPGIDIVAPGVAVITTAPGEGYISYDGTAVAAAHITGLAALILAHHDALRNQPRARSAARVDEVHTRLRAGCRMVPTTDPSRAGCGLPDAPATMGVAPSTVIPSGAAEAVMAVLQAEMQRGTAHPLY